jgi:2-oxoglutarate ferredoxin oxidoreductase subunit gamma
LGDPLVIVNTTMCAVPDGRTAAAVDATDLANEMGDARAANMVMVGVYAARNPIVRPPAVESEVRNMLAGKTASLVDLNIRAFREGLTRGQG